MRYFYHALLYLLIGLFCSAVSAPAQLGYYHAKSIALRPLSSTVIQVPDTEVHNRPFATLALETSVGRDFSGIKVKTNYNRWELGPADHPNDGENTVFTPLMYLDKRSRNVEIFNSSPSPRSLVVHVFIPYPSTPDPAKPRLPLRGECDRLEGVRYRENWCPQGNCPYGGSRTTTLPTHMIVHHSAGQNSSSDWDAVVRSIWHFHVVQRGWDDIGYNWLIAPNGQLYEGRGDAIKGAHFCGFNSKTMGVCMMGTYTDTTPADTAVHTLQKLLTWTGYKYQIYPKKRTLHTVSNAKLFGISGHRDRCNTACPGDMLYATLPTIRESVAAQLEACGFKQEKEDDPLGGGGHTSPKNGFYVRPTLVHDKMEVRIGQDIGLPVALYVFNSAGKVIQYEMVKKSGDIHLDTRDYPAGIYVLYASNSHKTWWVKVSKL